MCLRRFRSPWRRRRVRLCLPHSMRPLSLGRRTRGSRGRCWGRTHDASSPCAFRRGSRRRRRLRGRLRCRRCRRPLRRRCRRRWGRRRGRGRRRRAPAGGWWRGTPGPAEASSSRRARRAWAWRRGSMPGWGWAGAARSRRRRSGAGGPQPRSRTRASRSSCQRRGGRPGCCRWRACTRSGRRWRRGHRRPGWLGRTWPGWCTWQRQHRCCCRSWW
mmetsp:Transcript_5498/g.23274  ORF Transcript_5498/g.23274 Transcript_5498/m.23274 type:complete len:216 (-) Transcript_5498:806-1453(-)